MELNTSVHKDSYVPAHLNIMSMLGEGSHRLLTVTLQPPTGVVYIGARDNQIHAIDIESRKEIWSYPTNGYIDAAPAISDGMLYATSDDGYVYAFTNEESEDRQALPQEGEASQVPQEKRPIGTVVRDQAPVYTEKDAQSRIKLTLNDGVVLPILNQTEGWYQIELPNGEVGWMDGGGIGTFVNTDDILLNTAICKHNRTLELIEGAEYPHWSPDGKKNCVFETD